MIRYTLQFKPNNTRSASLTVDAHLPYKSLEHLECHIAFLVDELAIIGHTLSAYIVELSDSINQERRALSLPPNSNLHFLTYREKHEYYCQKFFRAAPCDCLHSAGNFLQSLDLFGDDEITKPLHCFPHEPADSPLMKGANWHTYCKNCGDWLEPFDPNKKPLQSKP